MFLNLARKLFGSVNDRKIKAMQKRVIEINALEPTFQAMSDSDLKAQTNKLRARLEAGEHLDDVLNEAFATVREAAKRTLGQRPFDVQLMGGMVLHEGKITEMRTGEGKTLVATLPVYLNALSGQGVHVVTVNDYLAKRDSSWMGQVYEFLGMRVGCIVSGISDSERKVAYNADITYGTNNEFGFDYLRDNMKFHLEEMVQRPFNYAIVDEVDSILIDEARTPLIISGPAQDSSENYIKVDRIMPLLTEGDFEKDEKARAVTFTEQGTIKIEEELKRVGLLENGGLYDLENIALVHYANQALRAHQLFQRDKDYIVKDDKVIIIDEFTGRMMDGRRYSEGLHQAIEAKENVTIQRENQTLASITFQNYFRMYPKLAGMAGTAMTEAGEFAEIYNLDVVEIPTNVPAVRQDLDDEVYRTEKEKYAAIIKLIDECRERKQPVLVGTVTIEKSEELSALLKKHKIPHNVLNARYHEQEAHIIAQAGHPGAVTIATNMAGRGTDIQLGGNLDMRVSQEVKEDTTDQQKTKLIAKIAAEIAEAKEIVKNAGGLYIIGTERHESRRIDNQLRGRAGRQGDPGASKFFLSLEDDLMRIFGSNRMDGILQKLGLAEGEAITHPWINKALEKAQQKVEAYHFDIRKNLLRFDNVMNDQRKVIYEQRRDIMAAEDVSETVENMMLDVADELVARFIPPHAYAEKWEISALHEEVLRIYNLDLPFKDWAAEEGIADAEIKERLIRAINEHMAQKTANYGTEMMHMAQKSILLSLLDQAWKDHLLTLDHLRQGINLRAYAQKDPLNEYKHEAFGLFEHMLNQLREEVSSIMMRVQIKQTSAAPEGVDWDATPRNSLCPCGSGKKFKHCHGAV